eukprot:tig00001130_g7255.t1
MAEAKILKPGTRRYLKIFWSLFAMAVAGVTIALIAYSIDNYTYAGGVARMNWVGIIAACVTFLWAGLGFWEGIADNCSHEQRTINKTLAHLSWTLDAILFGLACKTMGEWAINGGDNFPPADLLGGGGGKYDKALAAFGIILWPCIVPSPARGARGGRILRCSQWPLWAVDLFTKCNRLREASEPMVGAPVPADMRAYRPTQGVQRSIFVSPETATTLMGPTAATSTLGTTTTTYTTPMELQAAGSQPQGFIGSDSRV